MKKLCLFLILICSAISSFAAEPQWGPFTSFDSLPGLVQKSPNIVANEAGKAAVIWIQNDTAYVSVFTPATGSWETPTNLGAADDVDICIDENGIITAVVLDKTGPETITSHTRTAGSTTFAAESVYAPGAGAFDLDDLEITCTSANGQVLFLWVDTGTNVIQSKYRANGILDPAAPTAATALPIGGTTPIASTNPIAHMLPDGRVHAAYYVNDGGPLLYTNVFTPGVGWSAHLSLGFPFASPFFDFSMNSQGNGIIVGGTNGFSPLVSTLIGGDWSISQSMNIDDVNNTANIATTIDENNIATVIWTPDPTDQVFVRSASIFSIPDDWDEGLSSVSIGSPNSLVVADSSGNGNLVVKWTEGTGGQNIRTLYRESNAPSFFSLQTLDSLAGGGVFGGSLAVNNNGLAFAAWNTANQVRVTIGIDQIESLSKALTKKRLIYQKGLYP